MNYWQICPKCNGQGIVSKPPYVAGDIHQWSSNSTSFFLCNMCNGQMKILVQELNKEGLLEKN